MATKNSHQSSASIKQEREARRQEKVEAFKRQQRAQRRNRLIGTISAIVGGVAVVALVVVAVVSSNQPKPDPASIDIAGLKTFGVTDRNHVDGPVDYQADYGMNPPAGGNHAAVWLNCGVYSQPVPNENAVHALEHGSVWITYDPDALSADEVAKLQSPPEDTYVIVSPYPGLPAPVVVSAWDAQVQLDGVDDPRLEQFFSKYWQAPTAPEPGAPCTGGVDAPGRVG